MNTLINRIDSINKYGIDNKNENSINVYTYSYFFLLYLFYFVEALVKAFCKYKLTFCLRRNVRSERQYSKHTNCIQENGLKTSKRLQNG